MDGTGTYDDGLTMEEWERIEYLETLDPNDVWFLAKLKAPTPQPKSFQQGWTDAVMARIGNTYSFTPEEIERFIKEH